MVFLSLKILKVYENAEFSFDSKYLRKIIKDFVFKSDLEKCIIAGGFFSKYSKLEKIKSLIPKSSVYPSSTYEEICNGHDTDIFIFCSRGTSSHIEKKIQKYSSHFQTRSDCKIISKKNVLYASTDLKIGRITAKSFRILTEKNEIFNFIFYGCSNIFHNNLFFRKRYFSSIFLTEKKIENLGEKRVLSENRRILFSYIIQTYLVNSFDLDLCKIFYSFKVNCVFIHISFFEQYQRICHKNGFSFILKDINYAKHHLKDKIKFLAKQKKFNGNTCSIYLNSYKYHRIFLDFDRFLRYVLKYFFDDSHTKEIKEIINYFYEDYKNLA